MPPRVGKVFKFSRRQGIVAAPCGRLDKDGAGNRTTTEAGTETGRVMMEDPDRAKIMKRAFELWEPAGMPEGRADEFYHKAEQELRNEGKSTPSMPDNL